MEKTSGKGPLVPKGDAASAADREWGLCGDWAPENSDLFQRIVSYRLVERVDAASAPREGEGAIIVAPAPGRVVAAEAIQPVGTPEYDYGQVVAPRDHPEMRGVVDLIGWHFKYERCFYFIVVGGKRRSRRYFADELMPI